MNATELTGLFVFTQTFRILIKLMQLYGITASCLFNFDGEMKVLPLSGSAFSRSQSWAQCFRRKTSKMRNYEKQNKSFNINLQHYSRTWGKKCMPPSPFIILTWIWFLPTPVPILPKKKLNYVVQLSVSVFLWVEVLRKNCITLFRTRQNKANSSCWAHRKPNTQKHRLWRGFSTTGTMNKWQTDKLREVNEHTKNEAKSVLFE